MALREITEGITGQQAADIVYQNDEYVLSAVETGTDILNWDTPYGFYNLAVPNYSEAFVASSNWRCQSINCQPGDRFAIWGYLPVGSGSLALVQYYKNGVLSGYEQRGQPSTGEPQTFTDYRINVPADVTLVVITSSGSYADNRIQKLTTNNIGGEIDNLQSQINSTDSNLDGLTKGLYFGIVGYKQNTGENTQNPTIFGVRAESINGIGITIVPDQNSPFKDTLPYKRIFNNTMLPTVGTKYTPDNLKVGTASNRPSVITVSYWMKENDIRYLWTSGLGEVYLGLQTFRFNLLNLLNNIGTKQTVIGTPANIPEYTMATLNVWVAKVVNGYAQIVQEWTAINWKTSFTGTTLAYYFIMNGVSHFYNYPLDIYNLTVLTEAINTGVLIYAEPNGAYPQQPLSLPVLEGQINQINERLNEINPTQTGVCRFVLSGENLYFASPFSPTNDLVREFNVARVGLFDTNPNVNITRTTVVAKESLSITGGSVIKNSGDDVCPANLNGSYIGGNHGWNTARLLTLVNHGKTFADIGSRWRDTNSRMFTILHIVDANSIWICSDNQATDGYSYNFVAPSGNLTYVSNGGNTATISGYTTTGISNLYNTVSENKRLVMIDGKTEATVKDKLTYCSFAEVIEDYDVFDLPDTLAKLTAGRPSGGYTDNVNLNSVGAAKLFNHNITYRLLADGNTLIFHNFYTYKKVSFNFHGFIQAGAIGSGRIYVPKVLPISDGVKTWNLTATEDWTTAPAAALNLTPDVWEVPASPPDRILNYNSTVNFHLGYLFDRGIGRLRRENPEQWLTRAGFLNTTLKLYPFGVSNPSPLDANTFLSCVCFRQWLYPGTNPAGRTFFGKIDLDNRLYIYLDYHQSIDDRIEVPTQYQGRRISVYEKTDNVAVLGDVATNEIRVRVNIDTTYKYGYAVLILE